MQSLVSIANLHWGGRMAQSPRLFPLFPLPPYVCLSVCLSLYLCSLLRPLFLLSAYQANFLEFVPRSNFHGCRAFHLSRGQDSLLLVVCQSFVIQCEWRGIRNFDSRCFSFSFFFFVSFLFPNWWNLFRRGSIGEVKRGKIEFIDYHSN